MVGANLAKTILYYACPTCNRLVRVIGEQTTRETTTIPSLVRCKGKGCGRYLDFGKEYWVNGEPYCMACGVKAIEENERRVREKRVGEARSGREA